MSEGKKLTPKQRLFVDYYLQSFNASDAARRAGYSPKTAYAIGSENLRKPDIQEVIESRLAEVHMSAEEALKLMADIARGDVGELINDFGGVDISQIRKDGKTKLIKKWKTKTITINGKQEDKEIHTEEIELYPADSAIANILKVHGKFTDRLDVTSGGEALKVIIEYADSEDNTAETP